MNYKGRCLYCGSFRGFKSLPEESILGVLCDNYLGELLATTIESWKEEISVLKDLLANFSDENGQIIFEYEIPRLGKRIDVVLLLKGLVFCLEFKTGETPQTYKDVDQVLDYALDLKNFHLFSQDRIIVPIFIAPNFKSLITHVQKSGYDDNVINPLITGKTGLVQAIAEALTCFPNETPVNPAWVISPYSIVSTERQIGSNKQARVKASRN